jgi:thiamine-phosphate pyrophosphorylase
MASRVDGIHVLIDPERVPLARLAAFVDAIAGAGARVIQVRVKGGSDAEGLDYTHAAVAQVRRHRLVSIVNDRVDWAMAAGADGVHLGQDDTPMADARRAAPALIIGASAGSAEELRGAVAAGADYVGIGPVYATPSKADAGSPLTPSGLGDLVRMLASLAPRVPAVAIGGITPANAGEVWRQGVAGIAVISAVAEARDPAGAVRALLNRADAG